MTHIRVLIQSRKDARRGQKLLDEVAAEDIREASQLTVGILESGMQSGKTSLMFCHEHDDGTVSVAQCSATNLEQLYHTLQGVKARFGDE